MDKEFFTLLTMIHDEAIEMARGAQEAAIESTRLMLADHGFDVDDWLDSPS